MLYLVGLAGSASGDNYVATYTDNIPSQAVSGETIDVTGTVGSSCAPGSAEFGLISGRSLDELAALMEADGDPREIATTVLFRPDPPGSSFSEQFVMPDADVVHYLLCDGSHGGIEGQLGEIFVTPPPTDDEETEEEEEEEEEEEPEAEGDDGANRAPVGQPDRARVAVGQTFALPAPGVLGNDVDPDGDTLVAVRVGVSSTIAGGRLSFRPDGSVGFVTAPDAPVNAVTGAVCIAYQARDPDGATSATTTLVLLVGAVGDEEDAVAAVTDGDGCRPPPAGTSELELTLTDGPGDLPVALAAPAPLLTTLDGAAILAAPTIMDGDTLAVQIPSNVGCFRTNCLWGYFGPPSYSCNQTVTGSWIGRKYGSMTAYAYLRKGLSDYVRVRPVFFQDGNRLDPQFVWRGGWTTKTFPYVSGPETYNRWVYARLHMRFGAPGSSYLIGFEAEWYDARPFARDRLLAKSGPPAMVPYTCVSGGL